MDNLKYEERIIAFVDILGFRTIIRESEKDLFKLNSIYKALEFLKGREKSSEWSLTLVEIEEDAQKKGVKNFDISENTHCTCFSDTIVVSVLPIDGKINEAISTLITNLSFVGSKLLSEGILIRGGLTIGKLIHQNNGIIMGQGIIDAYELESRTAKFPRIVLSNILIQKLNYPMLGSSGRYPYHQYLKRFDDGCVGFHQMQYFEVVQSWVGMNEERMRTELNVIREKIIVGLDNSFEHPDIFEKFKWLKQQYGELIILTNNIKEPIVELNQGNSFNIHFSKTGR